MRANEFLTESTALEMDGKSIAVRSSLGKGKGTKVTMLVTKDEWNAIKKQQANTETMAYDLASAESIVKDWVSSGSKVEWKTGADWNADARSMQNHRFRNDPEVADRFDQNIATSQDNARATTRASMRTVEGEAFPSVKTYSCASIARKHKVPVAQIDYELQMGTEVELEHTTNVHIAREIALDHLAELPDYYTRLARMERAKK